MDQTYNYKTKLADLIEASVLTDSEKDLWQLFMLKSTSDEDEAVFEAVSASQENLVLLTTHLRDKILEMDQLSEEEWKNIAQDEKEYTGEL